MRVWYWRDTIETTKPGDTVVTYRAGRAHARWVIGVPVPPSLLRMLHRLGVPMRHAQSPARAHTRAH
jgi:hypothetical protein